MQIQTLSNLIVFLIQFKESTLLRILGIKDPKSSKDLLYFMGTEEYITEYQSDSAAESFSKEPTFGMQVGESAKLPRMVDTMLDTDDLYVRIERFTDDLHLRTDGNIPHFPTFDGFVPDYVQIVSTKNSDPVSLNTLQFVVEAIIEKFQYGMGIKQIESVLFIIAFLRFIFLLFKYNLKTSFLITLIGIISCYIWYRHLLHLGVTYGDLLYRTPYTFKFMSDIYDLEEYSKTYVFNFSSLYGILWAAIQRASVDSGSFSFVDPISMLFSISPKPLSKVTDYIYYTIYRDLGPQMVKYGKMFYRESTGLATYMFFVRINKKRCPYHIRWHWTCKLILSTLEFIYVPFIDRITIWVDFNLEPAYLASYNPEFRMFTDLDLQNQYFVMKTTLMTLAFSHIGFVCYAMLQALCGQYFYVPVFTENTELHIGKREKTTYSGGNTPWDERDNSIWNTIIPGYAWYQRKTKDKKFRKRIRKIIKRLKKFFS